MSSEKVIIASNNAHKINEIKNMLSEYGWDILSLKEAGIDIDIDETGETFEENSYIKAKTIMDIKHDSIVIADDSGLEVYAIDNKPGIYSARFAGEHGNDKKNNNKLLELLKDVPDEKRGARFVSVIQMLFPNGKKLTAKGIVEGKIGYIEKGSNGFGYDPLFIIPELNKAFAELTFDEKNSISHRARALKDLKRQLKELIGKGVIE